MSDLAAAERAALCDTFEATGPHAPTLCHPWDTAMLAAHLVIRERRPDTAPGILLPVASAWTNREQKRYAAKPWADLVGLVRSGPPIWHPTRIGKIDDLVNLAEFFVHHEDVRRAADQYAPRELDPAIEAGLWAALVRMSPLLFRRSAVGVTAQAPGFGEHRLHGATRVGEVTITGSPGELLLLAFGRGGVATGDVEGPPEAIDALWGSPLGIG